jgi:ABC-2 type transport system permease protein
MTTTPMQQTANPTPAGPRASDAGWRIIAGREIRDLWVGGRGAWLLLGFSILLSGITYLTATNQVLNFLEQREAVSLTLEVALAVGVLVTLLISADAVSGERERGTWEGLLLAPISRRQIVVGKVAAALSMWVAAFVVSIPYLWVLGHGVSVVGSALLLGLLVGTLVAAALAALGLLISAASNTNKVSLSISLLLLFILFAPTQLPSGPPSGWFGAALIRLNPIGSALHYISSVLVDGHSWDRGLSYLLAPLLTLVLAGGALILAAPRLVRLSAGARDQ